MKKTMRIIGSHPTMWTMRPRKWHNPNGEFCRYLNGEWLTPNGWEEWDPSYQEWRTEYVTTRGDVIFA